MYSSVTGNLVLVIVSTLCVSQTKSAPPLAVVSGQGQGQYQRLPEIREEIRESQQGVKSPAITYTVNGLGGRQIVQQTVDNDNAISRVQSGNGVQFVQPQQYTLNNKHGNNNNNDEVNDVERDGQGQAQDFVSKFMNLFSFGRFQKNLMTLNFLPGQSPNGGQKNQATHNPETRKELRNQSLPFCDKSGEIPFFGTFVGFWCNLTDNIFAQKKQSPKSAF